MPRYLRVFLAALALAAPALAAGPATKHYKANVRPASPEAERSGKNFRLPPGTKLSLWAAEPMLANPVAFCLDHKGRVYVAETFRLHQGVSDIRGYLRKPNFWLDDDLACRTVADRVAMTRKHMGKRADSWAVHHERVRRLEDADGKGRATRASVFADGFSRIEDGIGAGLLARGDAVWFTCIPDLVRLRDPKGLGIASEREVLSTGYGVHMGYLGHDLHGLILGPDGRLYFSIGDRGLNVVNKEGKRLFYPDTGCVLRCEPDGSNLEVFASGLRNPQELAFDDHGNLFTCDNNSDGGDRARWVYVMPGGDCGWRIGYQFGGAQSNRGPWNAEKMWHPPHKGQPAWIVPPITNLADGPSGLTHYPGVGLPDRYEGHFFLADFRGGPGNSGIRSFANRPKGAGFELADSHEYLWRVLATDVDFGPDGSLYVSDWVDGWGLTGKGRIWRLTHTEGAKSPYVEETRRLLAQGFSKDRTEGLERLLGHKDRRVRQEAHLELAARGKAGRAALTRAAQKGKGLARLHAIWGLGIQGRKDASALAPVRKLLEDADDEVRAQACRVIGEAGSPAPELVPLLKDESPRVRSLAALALGQAGGGKVEAVVKLLADNNDADPWLRHAGVMALAKAGKEKGLEALATHSSPAVRLGAVLALRRHGSPAVARFLDDAEADVVTEAARAINDAPIQKVMAALAGLLPRTGVSEPALYRSLNAAYRLGTKEHAEAVARFAARSDVSAGLRKEALYLLENWTAPGGRDRILGVWRPLPARSPSLAANALKSQLAGIFTGPQEVQRAASRAAAKLGVKEVGPTLLKLVKDETANVGARADALRALLALKDRSLDDAVKRALRDGEPEVRAAGREVLASVRPAEALKELQTAATTGTTREVQSAFAVLGRMRRKEAEQAVGKALDALAAGKVAPEARLDLVLAAEKYPALRGKLAQYEKARPKGEPFGRWRDSLVGGDAEAGKAVFLYKSSVSCLRCHKAAGVGTGEVGPDLTGIGAKQKREYLLESIVYPSKQIAKGYDSVQLKLASGLIKSGILKSEDAKVVRLMTPEGALVEVKKAEIEERTAGKSAMPEDLTKHLTRREVRDLVEFLASLKEGGKK